MLEAADGAQAAGWPAFHKSKLHASPLLYDVDSDGVQDILVATYDGQILAFRDTVRPAGLARAPACRPPARRQQQAARSFDVCAAHLIDSVLRLCAVLCT